MIMKQVIHIYGASGSGTSTLGRYISEKSGYFFMDTDDYFWEPTNPPYTVKRSPSIRLQFMKEDIERHDNVVISGSLVIGAMNSFLYLHWPSALRQIRISDYKG